MSQDPTLSGEEISALMSEAHPPREGGASGPARPFAFGGDPPRTMSAIPAIDRLNERMMRRLRDAIEPFARVKPKVATEPCTIRSFAEWQAEHKLTAPILVAQPSVQRDYRLTMTPTHYLIDARRTVLWKHAGYKPGDEVTIQQEIEKALAAAR